MYKYILLLILFLSSIACSNKMDDTLIKAITNGDITEIKTLIGSGANVNAKDKYSNTALTQASMWGHTGVVKFLIDKGVDINAKSKYGDTALIYASKNGHLEVVKLLKAAGATE